MSERYVDRARRMRAISTRANPVVDQRLLYGFALTETEIAALQHVVCNYMWQSANEAGVVLETPNGPDWFTRNAAAIRKLPNVTPNGVVMPKIENNGAYNLMHQMVVSIVGKDLNPDEVEGVFAPINVRLVDGQPNPTAEGRPRASTKMHSDIWAAEPSRSATLFLTVMGDTSRSTVDFWEPLEFPAEYQRPLADYLEGAHLADGAMKYPASFLGGRLLVMDAFCLHKTIKATGGGPRVSLDFRIIYKTKLPSDAYLDTPRRKSYLPLSLWTGIGRTHALVSRKSIKEFIPDVTVDAYASPFEIATL